MENNLLGCFYLLLITVYLLWRLFHPRADGFWFGFFGTETEVSTEAKFPPRFAAPGQHPGNTGRRQGGKFPPERRATLPPREEKARLLEGLGLSPRTRSPRWKSGAAPQHAPARLVARSPSALHVRTRAFWPGIRQASLKPPLGRPPGAPMAVLSEDPRSAEPAVWWAPRKGLLPAAPSRPGSARPCAAAAAAATLRAEARPAAPAPLPRPPRRLPGPAPRQPARPGSTLPPRAAYQLPPGPRLPPAAPLTNPLQERAGGRRCLRGHGGGSTSATAREGEQEGRREETARGGRPNPDAHPSSPARKRRQDRGRRSGRCPPARSLAAVASAPAAAAGSPGPQAAAGGGRGAPQGLDELGAGGRPGAPPVRIGLGAVGRPRGDGRDLPAWLWEVFVWVPEERYWQGWSSQPTGALIPALLSIPPPFFLTSSSTENETVCDHPWGFPQAVTEASHRSCGEHPFFLTRV